MDLSGDFVLLAIGGLAFVCIVAVGFVLTADTGT